ncbi:MAG: hypothetical protein D8M59_16670 [Planctomycetes bacterium]|nr:hypothetical protein [Planctomycetota bacterium]NOG53146.1 hypothetical protein [Planctomycetota bacterium]
MPKRRRKQVPSYCKHRASGQAVVYLNGQSVYLGPHGTEVSKAEYDRVIAEWLAAGRMYRPSVRLFQPVLRTDEPEAEQAEGR